MVELCFEIDFTLRLQIGDILGIASVLFRSDQFRFSQLSPAIFPATPSSSDLCINLAHFNKSLIGNVHKLNFIHCIESFKVKNMSLVAKTTTLDLNNELPELGF